MVSSTGTGLRAAWRRIAGGYSAPARPERRGRFPAYGCLNPSRRHAPDGIFRRQVDRIRKVRGCLPVRPEHLAGGVGEGVVDERVDVDALLLEARREEVVLV